MRLGLNKKIILILILMTFATPVFAESLFRAGVAESHYPVQPRSLYGSIKARTVGDIITVFLTQSITSSDKIDLALNRSSTVTDRFSQVFNIFLPSSFKIPSDKVNNFGGDQKVSNTTQTKRTIQFKDTIAAQVTQVLPNGNLVIQGKKATVNAGEKMNVIITGIVDPRLLSSTGIIDSKYVANLQVAMVGDGTISRSGQEGVVNKFFRFLF